MNNKKYELTNETMEYNGIVLHRIKTGNIGGWVEKEDNLSQEYDCWIYNNAKVYNNARVCDSAIIGNNAEVWGNAIVCGNAIVYSDAIVCDYARVYDNAIVFGNARIGNNAYISDTSDYICIGPIGSRLDYTTFYLDKDKNIYVCCGCYNGTIDEFKDRLIEVHKDNKYAKQYLNSIGYVLSMIGGRI